MDFKRKTKDELISELKKLQTRVSNLGKKDAEVIELENALSESEACFQLLYQKSPVGYHSLDSDGKILEVNPAWLELLEYTREEVVGRSLGDFLALECIERFKENFPIVKKSGKLRGANFEMITKTGSRVEVEIDGNAGYDTNGKFKQIHCVMRDVSEWKQTEQALQESHAHLRALIESPKDIIIFSLDTKFRYTFFNERHKREMRKIYNVDIEEGMNMLDLIPLPDVKAIVKKNFDLVLSGESFSEEQGQPGHNITYQFFWSPVFSPAGEVIGITCLVIDITERKLAVEELKKHRERLEESVKERTKELEEKNAELERFNKLFVGREFRIKELKEEIKELKTQLNNLIQN